MMPVRLSSPWVARNPTRLFSAAGIRIEPQVSLPIPAAAKLAATAAPVPPLEPPGTRSSWYGLRVNPKREPMLVIPYANSCMVALARMTAPASRRRVTRNASWGGIQPRSTFDPAEVSISVVS